MDARALLARLQTDGHNLRVRGGRLVVAPSPPQELWPAIREAKATLLVLLTEAPAAQRPAEAPRCTKPGICPDDPPAPVVDPEATRTLTILELAGAQPGLTPDGRLELGHPEHASDDLRAALRLHEADIIATFEYRSLLERLFPVGGESEPKRGD